MFINSDPLAVHGVRLALAGGEGRSPLSDHPDEQKVVDFCAARRRLRLSEPHVGANGKAAQEPEL